MVESIMPKSLDEALEVLSQQSVVLMAGGTDLMVKFRNWHQLPPQFEKDILFISHIEDLKYIYKESGKIHIGSMMTLEDLLSHIDTPDLLKMAIGEMASPSIRHSGTIGGNIGNASPAGDTLPVLYILNAKLVLASIQGERIMPIEDFIFGPGKIDRKPNELIKEIIVDDKLFTISSFKKVGGRKADAISKVAFCGCTIIEEDIIKDFRVAFNAVGPRIVRDKSLEKQLIGKSLMNEKDKMIKQLKAYSDYIKPIDDQRSSAAYRKKCAMNLLEDFVSNL